MNAIDLRDVIPTTRADDDEEVGFALTTAAALWGSGEHEDALRWIRRAAETANELERDERALELFKIAATLRTSLAPSPPSPVSKTVSKAPSRLPPPLPPPKSRDAKPRELPVSNVREMPLRRVEPAPRKTEPAPPPSIRPSIRPPETLQALRVLVLATGHGEARIIPIAPGAAVPAKAITALLVPTCGADAAALLALLSG